MATHYQPEGYTPIKVGHTYARYPAGHMYCFHRYKLVEVNEATGMCRLIPTSDSKYVLYMSKSTLSNWYVVGRPPR